MEFYHRVPPRLGQFTYSDGPITVGIDGGYVRDWEAKKHNFEVIVGKSTLAFKRDADDETPASKRFGFVQTLDAKPKRRLFEVLTSQGMQLNQQITFLSDGSDTVRELQLYMSPEAEHILDWHHVTMRLTVLDQYAKGLVHCDAVLGEDQKLYKHDRPDEWFVSVTKAFLKALQQERLAQCARNVGSRACLWAGCS